TGGSCRPGGWPGDGPDWHAPDCGCLGGEPDAFCAGLGRTRQCDTHRRLAGVPTLAAQRLPPRGDFSKRQEEDPIGTAATCPPDHDPPQAWPLGTQQGAVSHKRLDYYLDEFTFGFNRRRSRSRGKLFFRLAQQAVAVDPIPYDRIVHPTPKDKTQSVGAT